MLEKIGRAIKDLPKLGPLFRPEEVIDQRRVVDTMNFNHVPCYPVARSGNRVNCDWIFLTEKHPNRGINLSLRHVKLVYDNYCHGQKLQH